MRFFSKEIKSLLSQLQVAADKRVQMIPKSRSGINPGDLVFFKYPNSGYVATLVVTPVFKDAKTGNRLFTAFKIPFDGVYTADSLDSLYKNKELDKENYRTYRLNRIQSPIRRIK